jgi:hypothetical protein
MTTSNLETYPVQISWIDDGRTVEIGFDPEALSTRFYVSTLRDRAEAVVSGLTTIAARCEPKLAQSCPLHSKCITATRAESFMNHLVAEPGWNPVHAEEQCLIMM